MTAINFGWLNGCSHLSLQINLLSVACKDSAKDKYAVTVGHIIAAAKQIREEVRKP